MNIYTYERLKKISKKVKIKLEASGIHVAKTFRFKKRDGVKKKILFEMALNRLKKFQPKKIKNRIILPYLIQK